MGFWSSLGGVFKKIGKAALKVAPIAASFIPGIGPIAGFGLGAAMNAKKGLGGALKGGMTGALGSILNGAAREGYFGGKGQGLGSGINKVASSSGILPRILLGATGMMNAGIPNNPGFGGGFGNSIGPGKGFLGNLGNRVRQNQQGNNGRRIGQSMPRGMSGMNTNMQGPIMRGRMGYNMSKMPFSFPPNYGQNTNTPAPSIGPSWPTNSSNGGQFGGNIATPPQGFSGNVASPYTPPVSGNDFNPVPLPIGPSFNLMGQPNQRNLMNFGG